ncbi:MAG: alpha/beta hydrolase-fold protein [Bacteroidetes bacterium]|nr:alpha/beta hydrolase-fold protein [Bacteroidota bacterium]
MNKSFNSWYSPALNKEMPIVSYGHYGFALLLIPTAAADYLEYDRFQLIDALAPQINAGKLRVYSIDSMNKESWMNNEMVPEHNNTTSQDIMIYTCGASFGALHAMNLFLKRPDIINGAISLSGVYNLTEYTKGFWDDQVFYNSPEHYMPSLEDTFYLDKIKASHHIHIFTGSGAHEDPGAAKRFASILYQKGIWYDLEVWGDDIMHDWPTWRKMLPYIIEHKF